ncbi:hypothetical protein TNCV_2860051 [Trichonephila clavipes]|nr:hypothetical protein TNCV_2860051 [Trichonephila clavipes]
MAVAAFLAGAAVTQKCSKLLISPDGELQFLFDKGNASYKISSGLLLQRWRCHCEVHLFYVELAPGTRAGGFENTELCRKDTARSK